MVRESLPEGLGVKLQDSRSERGEGRVSGRISACVKSLLEERSCPSPIRKGTTMTKIGEQGWKSRQQTDHVMAWNLRFLLSALEATVRI